MHGSRDRLGRAAHEIIHRKINVGRRKLIAHGWERADEDYNRCQILIGKRFISVIGHHGENRAVVMLDAFANGASDLVVRPGGSTGLGIGSEVRRRDGAGKIVDIEKLAGQFHACGYGSAMFGPVVGRVAGFAAQDRLHEISAASEAFRCAFKLPVGGGSHSGSEERTPADGESDGHGKQDNERRGADEQNSPELFQNCFPTWLVNRPKMVAIVTDARR